MNKLDELLEDYIDRVWKAQFTGIIRGKLREIFKNDLKEIDKIVRVLIKTSSHKSKNLLDFIK